MSQNPAGAAFAGGGVTPQQAQLSNFTRGEREVGAMGRFSGIPMSTNLTQAGGVGPDVGQATNLAETSDALSAALGEFANLQQATSKGITGSQLNTLGKLTGKTSASQ